MSISGSSNVAKVTAIECRKHLRSEARWRSSLSKASRTTFLASPKINADQQKWIKIPKEPKNRKAATARKPPKTRKAELEQVDCRPCRVEACSMTLDWRGCNMLLLLLLLLRVMVRVPMIMQKSQKSANAPHQKKQKHNSPVNSLRHEARAFNN